VANLESWKNRINDLLPFFKSISFAHIYRERNIVVDGLSKKALNLTGGHIAYNQWNDGQEGSNILLKM